MLIYAERVVRGGKTENSELMRSVHFSFKAENELDDYFEVHDKSFL